MNIIQTNQKGSGTVVTTITITALVVICATFWALHSKNNVNEQLTTPTQSSQASQSSSYKNFVAISAWNVKFGVNKPSSQFKVGSVTTRNGNQVVTVTNSAQAAIYKGCGKTTIERSSSKTFYDPTTHQMVSASANSTAKQIGKYWYKLQPSQSACYQPAIADSNDEAAEGLYQAKLDKAGSLTDPSLSNLVVN